MGAETFPSQSEPTVEHVLSKQSAFTPYQARRLLVWLHSLPLTTPLPSFPRQYLLNPNTGLHASKFGHGQSNPTYKITLYDWQRSVVYATMVLRVQPGGKLLPGAHRLDREFKVLEALWSTPVPVPCPYAFCPDGCGVFPGRQFYLMEYVPGNIFDDISMPELLDNPGNRSQVFQQAIHVLSLLRNVDIDSVGLANLSRPSPSWLQRQVDAWENQIKRSQLQGFDYSAVHELHSRIVKHPSYDHINRNSHTKRGLVHGDFRIDNLVFQRRRADGMLVCVAVLDWELVALGDPLADFASFLVPYYMPTNITRNPVLKSYLFPNSLPPGIPTKSEVVTDYVSQNGSIPNLSIYVAVTLFRCSGILCGVLARARQGNASSAYAEQLGLKVNVFANVGINALNTGDEGAHDTGDNDLEKKLRKFMKEHVFPLENDFFKHTLSENRWEPWEPLENLKDKAKTEGLWNLFLPKSLGGSLTAAEYAPLATIMGGCVFASEAFNCSAPDTGNMELLARYGTEEQKARWLKPLLNGEIRSCFGMTEPEVASSDATNLKTKLERQGEDYVINGRKWWISGAMDRRCKVMLLITRGPLRKGSAALSQPAKHRQHTVVLVPMDTPGVRIIRPLSVFGFDDAPHGHAEIELHNVRVVARDALLHTEGGGFEAAQSRLGGGRLHHCMRLVGVSERAIELMCSRAASRSVFGKDSLLQNDAVVQLIGESRCDVETMRAVVSSAARAVDSGNHEQARLSVGATKVAVPRLATRVIDRAIQIHGGLGVCQDTILGLLYAHARTLRIADGPDEVHLLNIAKDDIRKGRASKL